MTLAQFPFPILNATLNGISAVLLVQGLVFIKRQMVRSHAASMIAAFCTSTVFLACYITYHTYRLMHGISVTHFPASRWKIVYLIILNTHTLLAVVTVPLVIITLLRAWRRQWEKHRRIAVWTFPIWLYVSVTGVIIYWMLYHLAPMIVASGAIAQRM